MNLREPFLLKKSTGVFSATQLSNSPPISNRPPPSLIDPVSSLFQLSAAQEGPDDMGEDDDRDGTGEDDDDAKEAPYCRSFFFSAKAVPRFRFNTTYMHTFGR